MTKGVSGMDRERLCARGRRDHKDSRSWKHAWFIFVCSFTVAQQRPLELRSITALRSQIPRRLCTLCVSWDFDYLFFLERNKKFLLISALLGGYINSGFGMNQIRIMATLLCCLPASQCWPLGLSLVFKHIFLFSSTSQWISICLKKQINI